MPRELLIPPPWLVAVLPLNVTFVRVSVLKLPITTDIPPPVLAELALKVTFFNVIMLYVSNPPPTMAEFPLKVTFVNVEVRPEL